MKKNRLSQKDIVIATLKNTGTFRHTIFVFRLPDGKTVEDMVTKLNANPPDASTVLYLWLYEALRRMNRAKWAFLILRPERISSSERLIMERCTIPWRRLVQP